MFRKVLIANRGAIACRIIRTLAADGYRVGGGLFGGGPPFAARARRRMKRVLIGPPPAAESYLSIWTRFSTRRANCGAQAIHPGYGFLSENAEFAEACAARGIVFIGPTPEQMRDFGLKHTARAIAAREWSAAVARHRIAGFGGRRFAAARGHRLSGDAEEHGGRRRHRHAAVPRRRGTASNRSRPCSAEPSQLRHAADSTWRNSSHTRGTSRCRFSAMARATVIALGERDCSAQRRNQKVIEETPAPGLAGQRARERCSTRRCDLGQAVSYQSAGTVEFIYDNETGEFYFLEVNTRLQVEHGVTEEVTGIDLVEWMVRQAAGEMPPLATFAGSSRGLFDPGAALRGGPSEEFPAERGAALRTWPGRARRASKRGWRRARK